MPTEHIAWAARYAAVEKPDAIILAGDWYDMPSLSVYDEGKKSGEGRRIADDLQAGTEALELFGRELKKHAPRSYSPRRHVTLGNHEERIARAVETNAKLEGVLSMEDLAFKRLGWIVSPFLKPAEIDGITYIHYCPLGPNGRVNSGKFGAPNARLQATRMARSTVCGHRQGKDIAEIYTPGRIIRGVIAGSFYQHDERYLTAMGETYWRGVLMLNGIKGGDFDVAEMSLASLRQRYG